MTTTPTLPEAITVEPFGYRQVDYDAVVQIYNRCAPLYPSVAADWQRWDRNRIPEHLFRRFVACRTADDKIVGYGFYMHRSWAFHPRKFYFGIYVDPDLQGLGIGRTMYTHAMDALAPHSPISLESSTYADKPRARRFLEDRGFAVKMRDHCSRLELADFDPDLWADTVHRVDQSGIVVKNLTQLRRDDPEHLRKLYEMIFEIVQDLPSHDPITPTPYDIWLKRFADDPNRIDEAFLVALDGDHYVGVTMLERSRATDKTLFTDLTGVCRTYRRRGIATALKVHALAFAKANFRTAEGDIPFVVTENEVNNPMFQINVKLGFEKMPDELSYIKTLQSADDTEVDEREE